MNKQSRSHGCLLFANDCLRKENEFRFRSHDSLLLENDSFSRENDFHFRSHGDFTATSRLRDSEQLVVGNVFAWEVTFSRGCLMFWLREKVQLRQRSFSQPLWRFDGISCHSPYRLIRTNESSQIDSTNFSEFHVEGVMFRDKVVHVVLIAWL